MPLDHVHCVPMAFGSELPLLRRSFLTSYLGRWGSNYSKVLLYPYNQSSVANPVLGIKPILRQLVVTPRPRPTGDGTVLRVLSSCPALNILQTQTGVRIFFLLFPVARALSFVLKLFQRISFFLVQDVEVMLLAPPIVRTRASCLRICTYYSMLSCICVSGFG